MDHLHSIVEARSRPAGLQHEKQETIPNDAAQTCSVHLVYIVKQHIQTSPGPLKSPAIATFLTMGVTVKAPGIFALQFCIRLLLDGVGNHTFIN